jgi:hypothetical protein
LVIWTVETWRLELRRVALEAWRAGSRYASCLEAVREDVIDHQTHVMAAVEGFLPEALGAS